MTHACCPDCRLRVVTASPLAPPLCPGCAWPMVATDAAESVGFQLATMESLSAAAAAALPVPSDPRP